MTSLRLVIALVAFCDFNINLGDIKTASLLGKLGDEIYMPISEGVQVLEEGRKRIVCRLLPELYILKQLGHIWNKLWDCFLVGMSGFTRSMEDNAVCYRLGKNGRPLWILILVHDVLRVGEQREILLQRKRWGSSFHSRTLALHTSFLK